MSDKPAPLRDEDFGDQKPAPMTDAAWNAPGLSGSVITPQENPPELSAWDRFVTKGFATKPEVMVNHLQKQYPMYQIKYDPEQKNVVFLDKDGNPKGVLDPHTGLTGGMKELGQDVAEGVPEVLAGSLQGTGKAVGGAVGALATPELGGVGAIPGAMLGGGTANALGEAAREKAGELLGLEDNINPGEIGLAGAVGAVDPLIFGTGGEKMAAKAAFPAETVKKLVDAQKGLVGRGKDALEDLASPLRNWFYSKMSGIPKDTVKTGAENMGKIAELESNPQAENIVGGQVMNDVEKIAKSKQDTGKEIAKNYMDSDAQVQLATAKQAYETKIAQLEALQEKQPNDLRQQAIDELKDAYGSLGVKDAETVPADAAFDLKQRLKDPANLKRAGKTGPGIARNEGANFASQEAQNVAADSRAKLSKALLDAVPMNNGPTAKYAEDKKILDMIGSRTKNPVDAYNFVRNLKAGLAGQADKADQTYGTNLVPTSNFANAFETFRKGAKGLIPRTIPSIAGRTATASAGAGLGYLAGANSDIHGAAGPGAGLGFALGAAGGSPQAIRFYLENGPLRKTLLENPATRGAPAAIWNLLMNSHEQNPNKETE